MAVVAGTLMVTSCIGGGSVAARGAAGQAGAPKLLKVAAQMPRKTHGFSLVELLVVMAIVFVLLLGGGGWWYFTHSRKPKIALSVPLAGQTGAGTRQEIAPGRVLPVAGEKAVPSAPIVARPAPAPIPPPVPAAAAVPAEPTGLRKLPELSTGEKPDLLLAKRTERRFAKLNEWSARLNAKKATLRTPLQIEAFNEEAAKYHAELAEARAEAAARSTPAPAAASRR